jgi:hypothetical protein
VFESYPISRYTSQRIMRPAVVVSPRMATKTPTPRTVTSLV